MFTRIAVFTTLVALLGAVRADPSPLTPDGSVIFQEGGDCTIKWGADTTGVWKQMNIEFMSGDNFDMKHITTVATVDATTATSYTWTCPGVTPNSKIYFYQFSTPANTTLRAWTTRFAISDKDGNTTPPEYDVQPSADGEPGKGDAIPWGVGALTDASAATPAPTYIVSDDSGSSASSTASGSVSASASGSASVTGSATASASSGMVTKSSSASGSKAAASGSSTGSAAASSSAAAGDTSGAMGLQATSVFALGAVLAALGFAM